MSQRDETTFGDAITQPFWDAAQRHELVVQRCNDCGSFQFYPRPYCLSCSSDRLEWAPVKGTGTVYSKTTVHIVVSPEFEPPYDVAIVELDEGPRMLTDMPTGISQIGGRVRVAWRERKDAPPLPVFEPVR